MGLPSWASHYRRGKPSRKTAQFQDQPDATHRLTDNIPWIVYLVNLPTRDPGPSGRNGVPQKRGEPKAASRVGVIPFGSWRFFPRPKSAGFCGV